MKLGEEGEGRYYEEEGRFIVVGPAGYPSAAFPFLAGVLAGVEGYDGGKKGVRLSGSG